MTSSRWPFSSGRKIPAGSALSSGVMSHTSYSLPAGAWGRPSKLTSAMPSCLRSITVAEAPAIEPCPVSVKWATCDWGAGARDSPMRSPASRPPRSATTTMAATAPSGTRTAARHRRGSSTAGSRTAARTRARRPGGGVTGSTASPSAWNAGSSISWKSAIGHASVLQIRSELLQGKSHPPFDRAERNRREPRDLGLGVPAEVGELDRLALLGRQLRERRPHRGPLERGLRLLLRAGRRRAEVLAQRQLLALAAGAASKQVDGAVARRGHDPGPQRPSLRVEAACSVPELQERVLHRVLGPPGIAEDAQRHAVGQCAVAIEELSQRRLVAGRQRGGKLGVRQEHADNLADARGRARGSGASPAPRPAPARRRGASSARRPASAWTR